MIPIGLGYDDDLLYEQRIAEASLPRVFRGPTALREAAKTHEARVRLATSSHVDHTPEKAGTSRLNEAALAHSLRGHTSTHKEAFDVYAGKHAIEVKTIVESGHDRITMHPSSLKTKIKAAKKGGYSTHTVVFDTRKGREAVYYREGLGSFRLAQMKKLPGVEAVREALGIMSDGPLREGGPGSGRHKEMSHQVVGEHEKAIGRRLISRGRMQAFLQDKADQVYRNNPDFKAKVDSAEGDQHLKSFMQHWMQTELNKSDRKKESRSMIYDSNEYIRLREGGAGSGDHGHGGRPGEVGGSGGGGGSRLGNAHQGVAPQKERKKHVIGLRAAPGKGLARLMFGKPFKELEAHEKKQVKAAEKERKARGIDRPEGHAEASAGEKELQTAKIIHISVMGGGVSETYKVEMEGGLTGVFKNERDESKGEVGAWQVAKLVGMEDIHPPVVYRSDVGTPPNRDKDKGGVPGSELLGKGSLMKWWDGKRASDISRGNNSAKKFDGNRDLSRSVGFDYIIGNHDRHDNNWMISPEGKMELIDHGRSLGFRGANQGVNFRPLRDYFPDKIIEIETGKVKGDNSKGEIMSPKEVAKPFVEHKEEIMAALKKAGISEQGVIDVGARIDRMARKNSWDGLLGGGRQGNMGRGW